MDQVAVRNVYWFSIVLLVQQTGSAPLTIIEGIPDIAGNAMTHGTYTGTDNMVRLVSEENLKICRLTWRTRRSTAQGGFVQEQRLLNTVLYHQLSQIARFSNRIPAQVRPRKLQI